ncbi:MAG: UvrD-helicase domain-containing protein, partial [Desulfobacteraceae bacterium]|nr:UvrD-helicase domain-containing protein [Desulfobacteraceae bacterium]
MSYELLFTNSWVKNSYMLPKRIQKKIPNALKKIQFDPYNGNGKSLKLSKSQSRYSNLYRYKLPSYRIFYAVGKNFLRLLTIRVRNEDTYKKLFFNQQDMDLPKGDASFSEPKIIPTTHWDEAVIRDATAYEKDHMEKEEDKDDENVGLYNLDFLNRLNIPEKYWDKIISCKDEEKLIESDLPEEIMLELLGWEYEPIEKIIEEPVYELPSADDVKRLLKGTLKGFLLKLDPEQKKVAQKSLKGPTLVKGGPGTGKSLVALYRIRNLLTPESQQSIFNEQIPKILFVTFSTTLVEHSKQLLTPLVDALIENVTISSLDAIARQIIIKNENFYNPAQETEKHDACNKAFQSLMQEEKGDRIFIMNLIGRLKNNYILNEFDWVIEGRNILSLNEYLDENRIGRGTPLPQRERTILWKLHEKYIERLKQINKSTYNTLRCKAIKCITEEIDLNDFLYDVVVIDEAQDLSPIAIKLCLALCKNPEGIYLTADAGQSIYQRGFSWKRMDEAINIRGRTTSLKYNYRSTKQIATCSLQLLQDSDSGDPDTRALIPVNEGPKPKPFRCSTIDEQ